MSQPDPNDSPSGYCVLSPNQATCLPHTPPPSPLPHAQLWYTIPTRRNSTHSSRSRTNTLLSLSGLYWFLTHMLLKQICNSDTGLSNSAWYTTIYKSMSFFFFGCLRSSLLCKSFLQLRGARSTLRCSERTSHHSVFSCCGAQALGRSGFCICITQFSSVAQ